MYLNWRPYPNGLGELGRVATDVNDNNDPLAATRMVAESLEADCKYDDAVPVLDAEGKKKRTYPSMAVNMLKDNSFLPDAERDELHIEIYNYLSWLHAKLDRIEKKAAVASAALDDEDDQEDKKDKKKVASKPKPSYNGVEVSELKIVLNKLESAFLIIPHVKKEQEEAAVIKKRKKDLGLANQDNGEEPPFLEEILEPVLTYIVKRRGKEGKPKRRSRMRIKPKSITKPKVQGEDFDEMFQKLIRYKEKHGDCLVFKNYKDEHGDNGLYKWVRGVRERRARLLKRGIMCDEHLRPDKGRSISRLLTAERIEKLTDIGFIWVVTAPIMSWDSRFSDLMEYYDQNGRWPSHSVGSLGEWVHKQRGLYARNDKNYMRKKAPRLDEVGFEWTPRGNTRMKWDEGVDLLLEFGRMNGHFIVPNPRNSSSNRDGKEEDVEQVDIKSDAYRLYKWVESLHVMYRSFKLGRQSGSLTDERVTLLRKHGFMFRNGDADFVI